MWYLKSRKYWLTFASAVVSIWMGGRMVQIHSFRASEVFSKAFATHSWKSELWYIFRSFFLELQKKIGPKSVWERGTGRYRGKPVYPAPLNSCCGLCAPNLCTWKGTGTGEDSSLLKRRRAGSDPAGCILFPPGFLWNEIWWYIFKITSLDKKHERDRLDDW